MNILDKIKNSTSINIEELINRLKKELGFNNIIDDEKQKEVEEQLIYSVYDVMIIILDVTHQRKVPEGLYSTWLRMIKDYWYLNKYDKLFMKAEETDSNENSNIKIKSIQVGDTTTTFVDESSKVNIDGVIYNTGTVNFTDNILIEKYKNDLYRHRKMRW